MKKLFKFRDSVNFKPLEISDEIKDYYSNIKDFNNVKPLTVKLAATHSGKVTRNNGFYLPHKMKEGAHTFLAEYNKPIGLHHESGKDPVGRVIDAKYVDLTPKSQRFLNKAEESKINDFVSGNLKIEDSIKFASEYIINDVAVVDDPSYEGLGYIELTAKISDVEAIQKVLDGRYLTGSIEASTNQAICSICKVDWANITEDSECDHRPGKIYDGKKCVLIAGDLTYDGWDFVNTPADRHSKVLSVNTEINSLNDSYEITLIEEDNPMEEKGKVLDETEVKSDESSEEVILDEVREFFGADYEDIVGDDEFGREYAEMLYSLLDDVTDETEKAKVVKMINDAKLSSKQRKALSESTFCGPGRSFPVPDCAHVTAARRLIGKYKGPGSKESILACVSRKAKRLGCDKSTKDMKDFFVKDLTVESFDKYDDTEVNHLFNILNGVVSERDLDCACDKEEITILKNQINELNDTLTNTIADAKNTRLKFVAELHKLITEEYKEEELLEKTNEELDAIIDNFKSKVDFNKINDFVNSGLSNIPEEIVEDPTLVQDNTNTSDNKNKIDESMKRQLKLEWLKIRTNKGQNIADKWLNETCQVLDIKVEDINS